MRSTSSLPQLKSQIMKLLQDKFDIKILRVFNQKGIEVADDDIYDILNEPIIYFSTKGTY